MGSPGAPNDNKFAVPAWVYPVGMVVVVGVTVLLVVILVSLWLRTKTPKDPFGDRLAEGHAVSRLERIGNALDREQKVQVRHFLEKYDDALDGMTNESDAEAFRDSLLAKCKADNVCELLEPGLRAGFNNWKNRRQLFQK